MQESGRDYSRGIRTYELIYPDIHTNVLNLHQIECIIVDATDSCLARGRQPRYHPCQVTQATFGIALAIRGFYTFR
jgi:hypothetical protein